MCLSLPHTNPLVSAQTVCTHAAQLNEQFSVCSAALFLNGVYYLSMVAFDGAEN